MSDKQLETRDDVRHTFDNLLKEMDGWGHGEWHSHVPERYKDGSVKFHLHLAVRIGHALQEICAEIQAQLSGGQCSNLCVDPGLDPANVRLVGTGDSQQRQPVLVNVHEILENRDQLIPSVVRLNALDFVHNRCGNGASARQMGSCFRPTKVHFTGRNDGKENALLVLFTQAGGALGGDLPRDVIERCPQIAKTIADDATELRRRINQDHRRTDGQYIALFLPGNSVWISIQVVPDARLESLQVLICPDDFESSAKRKAEK